MTPKLATEPVQEQDVPKLNDDLNVGEDLSFQRKWWRFENLVWLLFGLILICNGAGLFGRGWISKVHRTTADAALDLTYDRFQRILTPSQMTLRLSPAATHNREIRVFVSDSVVKDLGASRVSPQPAVSSIGDGGITYQFPSTQGSAFVQISLAPPAPGLHHFRVQVIESEPIDGSVFVYP